MMNNLIKSALYYVPSGVKIRVSQNLGNPRKSVVGRFVKKLLVDNNEILELAAVDLLNILPSENILEVGFGPGLGLKEAARRIKEKDGNGTVFGIDISEYMQEEAEFVCREEIASSSVQLHLASVDSMPFPSNFFDACFHVNCYYFWPERATACSELYRVLKPGGRMITTIRLESIKQAIDNQLLSKEQTDPLDYMLDLERSGFTNIQLNYYKTAEVGQIEYEAISAQKPAADVQLVDERQEQELADQTMDRLKHNIIEYKHLETMRHLQNTMLPKDSVTLDEKNVLEKEWEQKDRDLKDQI